MATRKLETAYVTSILFQFDSAGFVHQVIWGREESVRVNTSRALNT